MWDFHQGVTQILRAEIFNTEDTDIKAWDIQHGRHRSQDLRYSHITHRSHGLSYSTLDTTLKLWDIQHERHRTQDLRYSAWQNTELSIRDIQHGRKIKILTKRVCTFDTDLRLCDILYDWHRSGVLRYSSHRHRLETLSFLAHVTQTWDSEIFCTSDTESRLWDILHGWHST